MNRRQRRALARQIETNGIDVNQAAAGLAQVAQGASVGEMASVHDGQAGGGIIGGSAFDAANFSNFRTFLWGYPGGISEVDTWSRVETNRKAMLIWNNSPEVRFVGGFLQRHMVGVGVFPIACTSHDEFNEAAEENFENALSSAFYFDQRRQKTGWQMQRQIPVDWMRQGESFFAKVVNEFGFPQVQKIDPSRVRNSGNEGADFRIWDGVLLDPNGARTGYRVKTGDSFRDISAAAMMHCVELERDDQYRSPSIFYAGINTQHDRMDLQTAAKVNSKAQALLALAVKRAAGNGQGGPRASLGNVVGVPTQETMDSQASEFGRLIEQMGAFGAIAHLAPGEDIQAIQIASQTPYIEFDKHLLRSLAWAIKVQPEVLFFLADMGGTTNRTALEDLAAAIMVYQDLINEQFNYPLYVWLTAKAMKEGRIPVCKDDRWWAVEWQGPPKMSVDLGRMGALTINLRNAGMVTLADYWNGLGKGWRRQCRQIAKEIRYAKLCCLLESDRPAGEPLPPIVVDYDRDYRIVPGRTDKPEDSQAKEAEEAKRQEELDKEEKPKEEKPKK